MSQKSFEAQSTPRNELLTYIRSYEPYVDCDNEPFKPPPSEAACDKVLSYLPASTRNRPFRTQDGPRERNGIVLPRVTTDRQVPTSCIIVVSMTPSKFGTKAKWFEIWAAGVPVNTMCIQHGFSGDNEQINIFLSAQNDPSGLTLGGNVTTS
ncbi:hypothetical protein HO173_012178 [Letharia columbiana]|uniref:Uncharacterized protein n=1 Tax=Letharia columbiana TaxID=112416 RepID=A0A8H6FH18_9LECA|nr:uncharacterized protein HO173_012178 [Letharia columbiana]KAF6227539.1 hypothetical protein HO173_012178 [Letharia columbiana]